MKVVADSQAIVWYLADQPALSDRAGAALEEAELTDGIYVPAAGIVDLWYASQKGGPSKIPTRDYEQVKAMLRDESRNFHVLPLSLDTVPHVEVRPKADLPDPFDRMIVAAALEQGMSLVTADKRITDLGIVPVVW